MIEVASNEAVPAELPDPFGRSLLHVITPYAHLTLTMDLQISIGSIIVLGPSYASGFRLTHARLPVKVGITTFPCVNLLQ